MRTKAPGPASPATPPLLQVEDLWAGYRTRAGIVPAVRGVSFELEAGESLGLVGESGCGKTTLAYAVMNYLGRNGLRMRGAVRYRGEELADMPAESLRQLRGNEIAMVYQDPAASLNPVIPIGEQLTEVPLAHGLTTRAGARIRALEVLEEVRMPDPARVMSRYPHQLSGGQQQRVVIAMALMGRPRLLVMDEPTTGLDVTIEAAILDLIAELQSRRGMAMLFISHNMGTVIRVCGRVGVMYGGEVVEMGGIDAVFRHPRHPYTRGLLECLPTLDAGKNSIALKPIPGQVPALVSGMTGCVFAPRCEFVRDPQCLEAEIPYQTAIPDSEGGADAKSDGHRVRCVRFGDLPQWLPPGEAESAKQPGVLPGGGSGSGNGAQHGKDLLRILHLHKVYPRGGARWLGAKKGEGVHALNGVSFSVGGGSTLAIVGESGCGKSTLAKVVAGLEPAGSGSVRFLGQEMGETPVNERSPELVQAVQMVFQQPDDTLNPSHTVGFALGRALRRLSNVSVRKVRESVETLLQSVHLPPEYARRLPRQLSGGQKQRVAIARALAGGPKLLVADEPVSALDVSVQAAILNLLLEIQPQNETTLLFISHDLAVVRYLADHVCVMYQGQVMEFGSADAVFAPPYHPYTEALLSAVPEANVRNLKARRRIVLEWDPPDPSIPPKGCPFASRCHRLIVPV
ncbi:MAG: ABC transporter ATP-binding protein [bacterium]